MSDEYVLDSSAVICLLGNEPSADQVRELAGRAIISAVNLTEVISKLQERGGKDEDIDASLEDLALDVVDFDLEQAITAGRLRNSTRILGLSLGDRACLALAIQRKGIAVTTDRAWRELGDAVRIMLVR